MDSDESAMPSMKLWKWPFWRGVLMLTCAALAVMGLVALFQSVAPSVVNLFSTKPFDYDYIHLKAKDGIDSVQATEPMENGGYLVASMLFDHDTRRVKGGVHLGTGPCDAPERTWERRLDGRTHGGDRNGSHNSPWPLLERYSNRRCGGGYLVGADGPQVVAEQGSYEVDKEQRKKKT